MAVETIYHKLRSVVVKQNQVAIEFYNHKITYSKLFSEIDKMVILLRRLGISKEDEICVGLPNIPSLVYLIYASSKNGNKIKLIHPKSSQKQITELTKNSKCFFTILNNVDLSIKVIKLPLYINFCGIQRIFLRMKEQSLKIEKRDYQIKNDLSLSPLISFVTSGTYHPSVVEIDSFKINHAAENTAKIIKDPSSISSILSVLPLFHIFGFIVALHTPLLMGIKIVLVPKYEPKKIASIIRQRRISVLAMIPKMYEDIYPYLKPTMLKSIRFAFCGGDTLKKETIDNYNNLFKDINSPVLLCEGYGMSEATGIVTTNTLENYLSGSVGKVISSKIKIQIINKNKIVPNMEIGNIYISGPTINQSLEKDRYVKIRDEIYYNTGDIGYVDNCGYLYFIRRDNAKIKISGIFLDLFDLKMNLLEIKQISDCYIYQKDNLLCLVVESTEENKILIQNIEQRIIDYFGKCFLPNKIYKIPQFTYNNYFKKDYHATKNLCDDYLIKSNVN